jgi:hypothetical protein
MPCLLLFVSMAAVQHAAENGTLGDAMFNTWVAQMLEPIS